MPPERSPGTMLILLIAILGSAILVSGCMQGEDKIRTETTGNGSGAPADNHPQYGSALLLAEAERELARMNSSEYSHTTFVDETRGIFKYDCSGFIDYAMKRADPGAFAALADERPVTSTFYTHVIGSGSIPGRGGWMRILPPRDLRPGDIIVWPRDSTDDQNGHIMIVAEVPEENPERAGELLVRVIDATSSRHADDTRGPGESGLGAGTVGIMTGPSGLAVGYFWRGGESRALQETEMAFARIA